MRILNKIKLLTVIVALLSVSSCRDVSVPKPGGYFRIDLPEKEYAVFDRNIPGTALSPLAFEYPVYGKISTEASPYSSPGWFNIDFPSFRARIYLTYKEIKNNLDTLTEETYRMNVKNHIIKADAINEMIIKDTDRKVSGILYDLKGNTATSVQFFVTDSINHFLRGSLYFSAEPNPDSLAPVTQFFREDIIHLIETLKWKNK